MTEEGDLLVLDQKLQDFEEALQEITMAAGAFNRDPLIHMQNCIRDMQRVAINVLARHGIKSLRAPVDEEEAA
jgi:hypothetical protein